MPTYQRFGPLLDRWSQQATPPKLKRQGGNFLRHHHQLVFQRQTLWPSSGGDERRLLVQQHFERAEQAFESLGRSLRHED